MLNRNCNCRAETVPTDCYVSVRFAQHRLVYRIVGDRFARSVCVKNLHFHTGCIKGFAGSIFRLVGIGQHLQFLGCFFAYRNAYGCRKSLIGYGNLRVTKRKRAGLVDLIIGNTHFRTVAHYLFDDHSRRVKCFSFVIICLGRLSGNLYSCNNRVICGNGNCYSRAEFAVSYGYLLIACNQLAVLVNRVIGNGLFGTVVVQATDNHTGCIKPFALNVLRLGRGRGYFYPRRTGIRFACSQSKKHCQSKY